MNRESLRTKSSGEYLDLRKRNIGNMEKVTLKDFHNLYTRVSPRRMGWAGYAADEGKIL
jgi:hypothetical protein